MKMLLAATALALLSLPVLAEKPQSPPNCNPSMGLSYVCGLSEPEDLLQVGNSKWIVASGMGEGGGLFLVDSDAKVSKRLWIGQKKPDAKMYPDCAAPEVAAFNSHGIALVPAKVPGTYTLYSVTHTPFESIHVFALDARGSEPTVTWTGCVKEPADFKANAVTATRDGTILIDVQFFGGRTDFISGNVTGGVWQWKPSDKKLTLLPGTELQGNNGIEMSKDEKEFYVAVSGTQTVAIYDRADTSKPARQVRTPWWNLDNIHWSGDRLIATGMMFDEPACGGTRKQMQDAHRDMNCHRGWVAGQLDPATLQWKVLGYGAPNPDFGGIATALVIGDTLWLSSFQMDRAAYRPLSYPR